MSFEGNGCGAHFGDAHDFIIGCPAPDACNLIPGNDRFGASSYGVWLQNSSSANTVEGNLIGTDKNSPESSLNSNYDVKIDGSGNAIGGDGAARNTIAFNGATECKYSAPVSASSETTPYNNGGLSIDLGDDGVLANDRGNTETGLNTLHRTSPSLFRRYPRDDGSSTIKGALPQHPNRASTIQFFQQPRVQSDVSGFSKGRIFIVQTSVTANPTVMPLSSSSRPDRSL